MSGQKIRHGGVHGFFFAGVAQASCRAGGWGRERWGLEEGSCGEIVSVEERGEPDYVDAAQGCPDKVGETMRVDLVNIEGGG